MDLVWLTNLTLQLNFDLTSCIPSTDETEFRNFIVWLEDQKIRHYKIEDRGNLRNIPSSDWPKSFEKVSYLGSILHTVNRPRL